jgi:uncharacterized membrane protein YbaN (DUF454 family)
LPTTPFVLLAAACFARSSDRFYEWLLGNKHFGPVIRQWRSTRSVSLRSKRVAQLLIVLTFGSTIAWFARDDIVRAVLAVLGTTAFIFISRLRVLDRAREEPDPGSFPSQD